MHLISPFKSPAEKVKVVFSPIRKVQTALMSPPSALKEARMQAVSFSPAHENRFLSPTESGGATDFERLLFMVAVSVIIGMSALMPLLLQRPDASVAAQPSCHWSWEFSTFGCMPSNEGTTMCALQFPQLHDFDLCRGI